MKAKLFPNLDHVDVDPHEHSQYAFEANTEQAFMWPHYKSAGEIKHMACYFLNTSNGKYFLSSFLIHKKNLNCTILELFLFFKCFVEELQKFNCAWVHWSVCCNKISSIAVKRYNEQEITFRPVSSSFLLYRSLIWNTQNFQLEHAIALVLIDIKMFLNLPKSRWTVYKSQIVPYHQPHLLMLGLSDLTIAMLFDISVCR